MPNKATESPDAQLGVLLSQLDPSLKRKFEKSLAEILGLIFDDDDPVWAPNRVIGISGGWRVGKTTRGAFKTLLGALAPNARLIWLVGADYIQAQEEFRMVMEWCLQLDLIKRDERNQLMYSVPKEGSRELTTITGCHVITKSAQHPERLAGVAPDGIVLCEPGQMSSEVYDMCLGRLTEKRGWLYMGGTLEDGTGKPRWQWYEDFILDAVNNPAASRERAFILPSWTNKKLFPLGEHDPELDDIRSRVGEYQFQRRYGGRPTGVENPCFPLLWEHGVDNELFIAPEPDVRFLGGAIGVDYGRTFEHPSAVVALSEDNYGRYWVREVWLGYRSDVSEIQGVVESMQYNYGIWQGCCDPNQAVLANILGYDVAAGGSAGGGKPTEMRISLLNGLLEKNLLYFDLYGTNVREAWASLRLCRRVPNAKEQLIYERPLGDDAAQAVMYAVEKLRGTGQVLPDINPGSVRFGYSRLAEGMKGGI